MEYNEFFEANMMLNSVKNILSNPKYTKDEKYERIESLFKP